MTPISDFFDIDLLEEQHRWELSQIAYFYQASEEEVKKALARANDRHRDNPYSTYYTNSDGDSERRSCGNIPTPPCGDVQRRPGESGAEDCEGVAPGGSSA